MDKPKYQYEGMKWMFELELLNSPQVINQLRFNILVVSKHIKEVELLIYRENKSMLVLLDLSWIGRTFLKKRIFTEVQEVLNLLLPSFRFRVTDDPKIMEMAVERVKKALTGGNSNENTSNPSPTAVANPNANQQAPTPVAAEEKADGAGTSPEPSPEKQPEPETSVQPDSGDDDRKEG